MNPLIKVEKFISNSNLYKLLIYYILIIILCGTLFFIFSYTDKDALYSGKVKINNDINGYFDALYFSFVTSTSLGYGDIRPLGLSRALSVLEVFISLMFFGVMISKVLYHNQERILGELYNLSLQERFTRIIDGLYQFRAEMGGISSRISKQSDRNIDEMLQGIEANLHLLSSYIEGIGVIISKKDDIKNVPEFKIEILFDNLHSSIAVLERLIITVDEKKVKWKNKVTLTNLSSISDSLENLCIGCMNPDQPNLEVIKKEIDRHITNLRKYF